MARIAAPRQTNLKARQAGKRASPPLVQATARSQAAAHRGNRLEPPRMENEREAQQGAPDVDLRQTCAPGLDDDFACQTRRQANQGALHPQDDTTTAPHHFRNEAKELDGIAEPLLRLK